MAEKKEKTHWLQNPNKNYLGHWDIPESGRLVLTISCAQWEMVKHPKTNVEESLRIVHFKEDVKPMICNETNASKISKATGIRYLEDSVGAVIELNVGVHVNENGELFDCIRVNEKSPTHKKRTMKKGSQIWRNACDALKNGITTIEKIREIYQISKTDEIELRKNIS